MVENFLQNQMLLEEEKEKATQKKLLLLINDTFTGDIRYVTGGGSNGWTDEVNVRLLGGKVKVLQAVNRGFTLNSEMTVDGATVEKCICFSRRR